MAAQNAFTNLGCGFISPCHHVHDGFTRLRKHAIGILAPRNRHLTYVFAKFDAWYAIDFDEFVYASQRRLLQARYEVRADAKCVNFVPVLAQRVEHLFVNVIRRRDRHRAQVIGNLRS